jgi:hypothetical protein
MNSMSVKVEKKNLMVYFVVSYHVITSVSYILFMVVYTCKKCGELRTHPYPMMTSSLLGMIRIGPFLPVQR